jgi:hypothetical protein
MKLWLFALLAASQAAPAQADISATYKGGPSTLETMKVEVLDDGTSRVYFSSLGVSLIRRDGRTFAVFGTGADTIVAAADDLAAAMRKSAAEEGKAACAARPSSTRIKFVRRGTVAVRGRSGDAWFREMSGHLLNPRPHFVISRDPALAPLSAPIADMYRTAGSFLGPCPVIAEDVTAAMEVALKAGAPLVYEGLELEAVDRKPIDRSRFALPKTPLTIDELIAVHKRNTPAKPLPDTAN